jgi:Ala-tRNA(Pro) deacylase
MAVATTLQEYLESRRVAYEVITHSHTESAMRTAEAAHVPGDQMAKCVLLGDDHSYLLAVIPATYRLELGRLNQVSARHLEMIPEDEMGSAFSDCERGAIPPVGAAYGIETILEADLARQEAVYFESGDHEHLIKMRGEDFLTLMDQAQRAHVSHHL